MRFQVPQFVDIEDRIIGPLTIKQFGMYGVAGMIITILYVLVDIALLVTLAIPIIAVAVLFAHFRIAGQSFTSIFSHGVGYFLSKRLYVWRRGAKNVIHISGSEYIDIATTNAGAPTSLGLLAQMLTTEGNIVNQDVEDPMAESSDKVDAKEVSAPAATKKAGPVVKKKDKA